MQPNSLESRDEQIERLDAAVHRLTSDVTSLKLEIATLVSALREAQHQQHPPRPAVPVIPKPIEPPSRPSPLPAAIVVLLATSLLAWQLIAGPGAERSSPSPNPVASTVQAANRGTPPAAPVETPATEPPVTPLVTPTVYKGTLAINADTPGARVFVNRKDVGVAPVRVRNLKAGAHLVWIESDGYRRWTRVVTVPAERVTRVSADLEPIEPVEIQH